MQETNDIALEIRRRDRGYSVPFWRFACPWAYKGRLERERDPIKNTLGVNFSFMPFYWARGCVTCAVLQLIRNQLRDCMRRRRQTKSAGLQHFRSYTSLDNVAAYILHLTLRWATEDATNLRSQSAWVSRDLCKELSDASSRDMFRALGGLR